MSSIKWFSDSEDEQEFDNLPIGKNRVLLAAKGYGENDYCENDILQQQCLPKKKFVIGPEPGNDLCKNKPRRQGVVVLRGDNEPRFSFSKEPRCDFERGRLKQKPSVLIDGAKIRKKLQEKTPIVGGRFQDNDISPMLFQHLQPCVEPKAVTTEKGPLVVKSSRKEKRKRNNLNVVIAIVIIIGIAISIGSLVVFLKSREDGHTENVDDVNHVK